MAASIEYRIDEENGGAGFANIMAAKEDMQAAVRWLRSKAVTYRLDPGKVAVGGAKWP